MTHLARLMVCVIMKLDRVSVGMVIVVQNVINVHLATMVILDAGLVLVTRLEVN